MSLVFRFVLSFRAGWAEQLMRNKTRVQEKKDSQWSLGP